MEGLLLQLVVFVCLAGVGWWFGRQAEQKHLHHLQKQERRLSHISMDTSKFGHSSDVNGRLISSSVVLSHDYFKFVLSQIRSFFGGNIQSYETVVERARREAIVRLKQKAHDSGANHIMAVRLSTNELGMQGGMVEVLAYGTAVTQQKPTQA